MDFPVVRISKILPEFGSRVYEFQEKEIPEHGWVKMNLDGFSEQYPLFTDVDREGFAVVLIHQCSRLPENARYVWQGRTFKPPLIPIACPRCRYRLENKTRARASPRNL